MSFLSECHLNSQFQSTYHVFISIPFFWIRRKYWLEYILWIYKSFQNLKLFEPMYDETKTDWTWNTCLDWNCNNNRCTNIKRQHQQINTVFHNSLSPLFPPFKYFLSKSKPIGLCNMVFAKGNHLKTARSKLETNHRAM